MFLGLTEYYRKFIPDLSTPLTDLTRKTCLLHRNGQQSAREPSEPSSLLFSSTIQRMFILHKKTPQRGASVQCSDSAMILGMNAWWLIPRETWYSTVEKECLTIKATTHTFRVYLLRRKFIIHTDHRALKWLECLKDNNSCVGV